MEVKYEDLSKGYDHVRDLVEALGRELENVKCPHSENCHAIVTDPAHQDGPILPIFEMCWVGNLSR